MRILVDGRRIGPHPTGVGNVIRGQLRGLDQCLASRRGPAAAITVIALPGVLDPADFPNLTIREIDVPPTAHPRAEWFEQVTLPRLAASLGATVIYSPAFACPWLSPAGVRTAVLAHDDLVWRAPGAYSIPFRLGMRAMIRLSLGRAHAPMAVSRAAARALERRCCLRRGAIHAIGNPVAEAFFHAGLARAPRARTVLVIGSDEPRKNQALVVRAMAGLRDVELHLAGLDPTGRGTAALLTAARRMNVVTRVLPRLRTHDLARAVAAAGVLAAPSIAEGFGLPVAEALAAGTPVVATPIAPHREIAGPCARYAPPADPAAWREALIAALESPHDPAPARRRVERYREVNVALRLLRHLGDTAGNFP